MSHGVRVSCKELQEEEQKRAWHTCSRALLVRAACVHVSRKCKLATRLSLRAAPKSPRAEPKSRAQEPKSRDQEPKSRAQEQSSRAELKSRAQEPKSPRAEPKSRAQEPKSRAQGQSASWPLLGPFWTQKCSIYNVFGWPEPCICTVYDRRFGQFPAKNAVYTPYIHGSGQLY